MIQRRSLISDSRSVKFYASCAAADYVFMLQGFKLISNVILSSFACNDFHSKLLHPGTTKVQFEASHFIIYHSPSCDSVTFNKKCRDALKLKCALCTWHRWTSLGLLSLFSNCAACFIDGLKARCLASKWGDWANECCCFLGVNVLWSIFERQNTHIS